MISFTLESGNNALLLDTLEIMVAWEMDRLHKQGGPTDTDFDAAQAFGIVLSEKGDNILFRSHIKGETARLTADLARAIAVLAFVQGYIRIGGRVWEAKAGSSPYGEDGRLKPLAGGAQPAG